MISIDDVAGTLDNLRVRRPLVHCLTNGVVKNFTANVLLAIGAAPAMVEHPDEAAEFAAIADALLINVGTLDEVQMSVIPRAVGAATKAGKPWVLDPVAVGPLAVRTAFARQLAQHRPAIVRGNASEIIALSGHGGRARGVDSGDTTEAAVMAARGLARHTGGAVLATGAIDYATDGTDAVSCQNGHILLTRVTGVGCAQGALAAACAAVAPSPLAAAVTAAVVMGLAGEIAASAAPRPGSFAVALLDALDALDAAQVRRDARLS